jgi:hypothetical protein
MLLYLYLFLFVIQYQTFQIFSDAINENDVLYDDAKRWCEYVKGTYEPDILLFNSIPLSGASTMKRILSGTNFDAQY